MLVETVRKFDIVLAQLRHSYKLLTEGHVKDPKEFANGLIAPQIRRLEQIQKELQTSGNSNANRG